MATPICTALSGTLERRADGWYWRDGTPEPRVYDLALKHFAPNFRCITRGDGRTYVEVPRGWERAYHWDGDPATRRAIYDLIREAGKEAPVFAERIAPLLDDHRVTQPGALVPVEMWDAVMSEPAGVGWDGEHEDEILARAESLGWKRG